MKRLTWVSALAIASLFVSGCFATKIIAVPLRVVGAAASVVPVVGDATHNVLDAAADVVD